MAAKANYLRQAMINGVLRNTAYTPVATLYLALYTTDPTNADTGTEVSGTGYARKAIAFTAPTTVGASENTALIDFGTAGSAWGTISHWGIRDALAAGNLLYYGPLTASRVVQPGDPVQVLAGECDIQET